MRKFRETHREHLRAYNKRRYATNPEAARKYKDYAKAYRAANPDKARHSKRRQQGILDPERCESLLATQGGICAVAGCGEKATCADHDHGTGLLRGMLCSRCNVGLGMFRDSLTLLAGAFDYLLDPPAQRRTET